MAMLIITDNKEPQTKNRKGRVFRSFARSTMCPGQAAGQGAPAPCWAPWLSLRSGEERGEAQTIRWWRRTKRCCNIWKPWAKWWIRAKQWNTWAQKGFLWKRLSHTKKNSFQWLTRPSAIGHHGGWPWTRISMDGWILKTRASLHVNVIGALISMLCFWHVYTLNFSVKYDHW